MTTTTTNLSLTLYNSTTDQSIAFSTFRADLAGTSGTSNFQKIDTAVGTIDGRLDALEALVGASIFVNALYDSPNNYIATVANLTAYTVNQSVIMTFDTDSDGTISLNINSLGAKTLTKVNSAGTPVNIQAGELQAGRYYLFIYDGAQWVWVSATSSDQIYHSGTAGNVVLVDSSLGISGSTTPSLLLSGATNSATTKATPVDADEIPITDSASTYVLKKLTWANLKATFMTSLGALINALTTKATPVDADELILNDSASSNATKKLTWANLKSNVASYYDSLSTTMTNKTLTTPIISSISNTGTVTLPTATDTLVGRATTDTLTNKRVNPRVGTTTSSATPTINTDNYDAYSITAQAEAITSMTTNLSGTPVNFQKLMIRIKDNGTARAITWGASFEAKGTALPTTTVISKVLTVGFIYDTVTSKWGCVASAQEA